MMSEGSVLVGIAEGGVVQRVTGSHGNKTTKRLRKEWKSGRW